MDCSPPGSPVHGIFQVRILDWVAMSSSRGSSQPRDGTRVPCLISPALGGGSLSLAPPVEVKWKWKSLSRVQLFATPWTAAHQAPLSMRFSRQGYWSGLPFPSPGDLPNPGMETVSLTSPASADESLQVGTSSLLRSGSYSPSGTGRGRSYFLDMYIWKSWLSGSWDIPTS